MWYLVIIDRTVFGVYGSALKDMALERRAEIADATHQIASIVTSKKRYHVGERLPANARIKWEA